MKSVTIMGILNITPDSFSDGGIYYQNPQKAVERTQDMLKQGADIIDIGGESTRPGSKGISVEEERQRVIPVITSIRKQLGNNFLISIDTNKSVVAKEALKKGANIVNSLGGMTFDLRIADVVKEFKCLFIIYHIKGIPRTMQTGEIIYKDIIKDIADFFKQQIIYGLEKGIKQKQFILDPGIGFGKTMDQNIEIIKRLQEFKSLRLPILIGVSRKSMLNMILKDKLGREFSPTERLEAGLAATAVAVKNGASIIRTHDVLQTKTFLTVFEKLYQ